MGTKTTQPSGDDASFGDGAAQCVAERRQSAVFAPSNTLDHPHEAPSNSRLRLSDFHNLVRSSSAAIACVEFSTPVTYNTADSQTFCDRLYTAPSLCLEASNSFARLRGYESARQLLDKPLRVLLPPDSGCRALMAEWHRRGFPTEGFEWELPDSENRLGLFHVALYGSFGDGTLSRIWVVLRDISTLARAINAVTRTERHFRSLLDRTDILYLKVYTDGTIATASKSTQQEFDLSVSPIPNIDQILRASCHPDDREIVERLSFHRRALSPEPLAVSIRLVGGVTGLATYEITQHPHLIENDIDAFDLIGIKAAREEKDILPGVLASGLAHDANNQLMVASASIERARLEVRHGHHAIELLDSALRSLALCSAINSQTIRLSSGLHPQPEEIDLTQLFSEVLQQCQSSLPSGITCHSSLFGEGVWAWADRTHLCEVLINLILNARDALGSSGVITLSATRKAPPPLSASSNRQPQVCISVSDNGPGIDATVTQTLFQPFVSTKSSSLTRGLGLMMVKTLIETNGGNVTVTSAQGLGTTFTVSVPESTTQPAKPSHSSSPSRRARPLNGPRRILIADDEPEVRKTLIFSLLSQGLEATAVPDSKSFLQELSRATPPYDLVILDDGMPGSTAHELCEAINDQSPATRIIVTSGNPALREAISHSNLLRFLAKPFSLTELGATIESLFNTQRTTTSE